mmetsp:Transcript_3929/g.7554  ORF Transcript_3929/g.7554 Transcript_3929/m.7554 type:complete len:222 (+) Transcript_3929:93-758(+)
MLLSTVSRFVFFNFPAAAHFQRLGAFSSASFSTSSFSLKCYCYYFTLPSTATATVCRATRLIVHDMLLSTVYCSTYLHTVMICYCQLLSTSTVRPTINCTLFFLRQLSTTSYGFWFCGHLSGGSSVSCGWFVCLCPAIGLYVCVLWFSVYVWCFLCVYGFLCLVLSLVYARASFPCGVLVCPVLVRLGFNKCNMGLRDDDFSRAWRCCYYFFGFGTASLLA